MTPQELAVRQLRHTNHIVHRALDLEHFNGMTYVEVLELIVLNLHAVNESQFKLLCERAALTNSSLLVDNSTLLTPR